MTKLDYFLLCENVIVDNAGRISIINIFDIVYATSFPVAHPKFVFTFRVTPDNKLRKKKDVIFKITVTSPEGKEFFKARGAASLANNSKADKPKVASSLDLGGLAFQDSGEYIARLFIDDEQIAERSFKVLLQELEK